MLLEGDHMTIAQNLFHLSCSTLCYMSVCRAERKMNLCLTHCWLSLSNLIRDMNYNVQITDSL